MNKFISLLLMAFFVAGCGESNSDQTTTTNDLAQLENDWMHATMKRDRATLDQLVADEFTLTGMKDIDSAAVTRSVWMGNTMQNLKIDSVHFIKTKVNIIGDVGIVRAHFYWRGTYDEVAFSDSTAFVDTWIKRNGSWLVVSRIMTD